MNKGKQKKLISLLLILTLLIVAISGCSKKAKTETEEATTETTPAPTEAAADDTDEADAPSEPKTIRWGTHWVAGLDPYYKDPTTGEYTMDEASRQASIAALDKAKELLNVDVEFVQYATDTRSELITSVLSNSPVCDIAMLWGGSESTILAQNIMQQLDPYVDSFAEPEHSWMLYDKLYGHYYFLSGKQAFIPRWPLIYNISMIEKVDALKDESGKTILPSDLFQEGKWTWSTFKDYLAKIQTFYANTAAPEACFQDMIQAYETDHRFAGLSAMYAAGGAIYGANGLAVDSAESLKGTAYIKELRDAGLTSDPGVYGDGFTPQWCQGAADIRDGGTVFTDCPDWWIGGIASTLGERKEALGIVPWPRPDDMALEDPNYQQVLTVGDSLGILKGVDEETTKLCLEFLKVFYTTYYEVYGGVDSVLDYKASASSAQATSFGFDIFNETYGDNMLKTFQYVAEKTVPNDYSDLIGVRVVWDNILGKSLYGIEGYAAYDVSVQANKDLFTKAITDMETILASGEIRDNIAPNLATTGTLAFAAGTDPATIKFSDLVTVTDAVEGVLDSTTATYDYAATDFTKAGTYANGLVVKAKDGSGNEATMNSTVIVFNPDNKKAPEVTIKEGYRTIAVDEDAAAINWRADFINTAVDADGIDVAGNVTADISSLDTTTAGDYDVVLTVTDFAGNKTDVTIKVTVAEAE